MDISDIFYLLAHKNSRFSFGNVYIGENELSFHSMILDGSTINNQTAKFLKSLISAEISYKFP